MDVHAKATVWGLVDAQGEVVREGHTPTTAAALSVVWDVSARFGSCGPYSASDVRAGDRGRTGDYLAERQVRLDRDRAVTDHRVAAFVARMWRWTKR